MSFEALLKFFDLTREDAQMIVFGAIFFIILWKLLDRAVFTPFLALYTAREAATDGAGDIAASINEEADQAMAQYEERIGAARGQAVKQKALEVNQAKEEANRILADATRQANAEMQRVRAELVVKMKSVREVALNQSENLVSSIVDKLKREQSVAH